MVTSCSFIRNIFGVRRKFSAIHHHSPHLPSPKTDSGTFYIYAISSGLSRSLPDTELHVISLSPMTRSYTIQVTKPPGYEGKCKALHTYVYFGSIGAILELNFGYLTYCYGFMRGAHLFFTCCFGLLFSELYKSYKCTSTCSWNIGNLPDILDSFFRSADIYAWDVTKTKIEKGTKVLA